jgi:hypothetical protein
MAAQPINPMSIDSTQQMEIGYRERSLWVSLVAVCLVDTLYFAVVLYCWWSGEALSVSGLIGLLGVVVGLLLLIEVTFVLVNRARREPMDERDQSIAAGAARLAYAVFSGCVVLALALHLLNVGSGVESLFGLAIFDVPLVEVHLVLAGLVTAELVRYSTALMLYRRGY